MVTNFICKDKLVNSLSNDTCRLLFTWLITFADREGRTNGDPDLVKSMVFPRREDVTIEMVENYLKELHDYCLILLYDCNGEYFVWFPNFDKNQPGLRKDREPESEIPPPTKEQIEEFMRISSGKHPAIFRQTSGLREENGMEENGTEYPHSESLKKSIRFYESEIGVITGVIADEIKSYLNDGLNPQWILDAIRIASEQNKRSWAYIKAVLKRWIAQGNQNDYRAKTTDNSMPVDRGWVKG